MSFTGAPTFLVRVNRFKTKKYQMHNITHVDFTVFILFVCGIILKIASLHPGVSYVNFSHILF